MFSILVSEKLTYEGVLIDGFAPGVYLTHYGLVMYEYHAGLSLLLFLIFQRRESLLDEI
jgi:hypothetical protein